MRGLLDTLRTGDWLTRERMQLVAFAALIASVIGFAAVIVRSDGYLDWRGYPIGTDFANLYAAGTFVIEGRAEAPFDPVLHHARQREILGENTLFFGWLFPPPYLFVAAVLALMPYGVALAAWLSVTFVFYVLSTARSSPSAKRRRARLSKNPSSIPCGCCLRSRSRRCWSLSVTARTASSTRR